MTPNESLEFWKFRYDKAVNWTDEHWEESERKEHFDYVCALTMAVIALERLIPVEPNGEYCPNCKRHLRKPKVSVGYTGKVKNRNGDAYCPSCGQSIEWSD